jgi:hypothetical protein
MELLFEYLTRELSLDPQPVAAALWRDYQRGGRRDKPGFLRAFLPAEIIPPIPPRRERPALPKRQARHVA